MAAKKTSTQGRLDSFFKVLPTTPGAASAKRKPPAKKGGNTPKRGRKK